MKNFSNTLVRVIFPKFLNYGILAVILLSIFYSIWIGYIGGIIRGTVFFFFGCLPLMFRRKWGLPLSHGFISLVMVFLFLHVMGNLVGWYETFYPVYELLMHFFGAFILTLIIVIIFTGLDVYEKNISLSLPIILFIALLFTNAFGGFWNIGEYFFDQWLNLFNLHTLQNAIYDMVNNLMGSILAIIVSRRMIANTSKEEFLKLFGLEKEPALRIGRAVVSKVGKDL